MSFTNIWIHSVWGTKYREPLLTKEVKLKIIEHIKSNAYNKKIYIDSINGHLDHLHCLLKLNAGMSIDKVMQLLKGESSFWANKNKICQHRIEWAVDYFAVSIDESRLEQVRNYINNQEEHHKKISFQDEYDEFLKLIKSKNSTGTL
jgi:REP element-mobilizing transposase RayT